MKTFPAEFSEMLSASGKALLRQGFPDTTRFAGSSASKRAGSGQTPLAFLPCGASQPTPAPTAQVREPHKTR